MEQLALIIFISSFLWIAYVYALYPLFLIIAGFFRRRPKPEQMSDEELPTVSILIPAYNEEKVIARKIESTLALDYPADKLEVTVVSDCSTDATDRIVQGYLDKGIRFIRNETQKGKIGTISELGTQAKTEVILITDANATFESDSLRKLVSHFRDPKVGIVNGNKVLERTPTMVGKGEGVYWIYETLLKRAESSVFSNAFITGAMTAIRRELFIPVPVYLEFDHILPLHVVNHGSRVIFEKEACFHEETAPSSRAEYKVRVRNAVRGFTMVLMMGHYVNVLRHPWFSLHVFSRKVMRWLIGMPAAGLFIANMGLLHLPLFQMVFAAQIIFYAAALAAHFLDRYGIKHGLLALPFYFCLVNYASVVGLWRALRGQRVAVWSTGR
jgi:cellulose synthase/poly-beta-1,6-N-acetylglucosamine synthase-like glycosyltransferase